MKKTGYSKDFAGGVEAAASSGGQLMPPVMGVAAYVIADFLSVPLSFVLKSAIIPAILYYLAIFIAVDFKAAREGLKGLDKSELPDVKPALKKSYLIVVPILTLVLALVVAQVSSTRAALWAIAACILCGVISNGLKFFRQAWKQIEDMAQNIITVALATATAGIVIAVLSLTGLGFKLSSSLVSLSGGSLFALLALTMICAIVLGMGLPTVASYILLATLVAPAAVKMGVPLIAAHLFIFYFGVLSAITPPVCIAVYAAVGISGGSPLKTALNAVKVALPGFLLPFLFVYNNALILYNCTFGAALYAILIALVSIIALAAAIFGYFGKAINVPVRLLFAAAAVCTILPDRMTDLIGLGIFAAAVAVSILTGNSISRRESLT